MKAPKCVKCRRYHFGDICTPALARVGSSVTSTVTTVTPTPTRYVRVEPIPGQECPTCGQVVPKHKTNAERQRAYRERVKAK